MKKIFTLDEVNKILKELSDYVEEIVEEANNKDAITDYEHDFVSYPIRIGRQIRHLFEKLNELDIAKEHTFTLDGKYYILILIFSVMMLL